MLLRASNAMKYLQRLRRASCCLASGGAVRSRSRRRSPSRRRPPVGSAAATGVEYESIQPFPAPRVAHMDVGTPYDAPVDKRYATSSSQQQSTVVVQHILNARLR